MRNFGHAFAAAAMMALPSAAATMDVTEGIEPSPDFPTYRRSGRGKGIQAKPKKRPNRLTISKRVRRKHRRS